MTRPDPALRDAGFTLVEVLVSVLVFSIISAMSVGLLTTALRTRDAHAAAMEEIAELQRFRAVLREDLGQFVGRPGRDADGVRDPTVLIADPDGADRFGRAEPGADGAVEILRFTRRGWANPGALRPRSTLQRVAYVYDGERLVRRAWPFPDAAPGTEPAERVLLENAPELVFEFRLGRTWNDTVRLEAEEDRAMPDPPPAVRVRYLSGRLGEVEHIVLTSGAEAL